MLFGGRVLVPPLGGRTVVLLLVGTVVAVAPKRVWFVPPVAVVPKRVAVFVAPPVTVVLPAPVAPTPAAPPTPKKAIDG